MASMFPGCSSLTSLDLSSFDTTTVTNMYSLVSGCARLQTIDLSSFNTENVTQMAEMFRDCKALVSLDLSNFDTSSATTMTSMFQSCSNLAYLDISSFDTSNVTNMNDMFAYSYQLSTVVLGKNFKFVGDSSYFNKTSNHDWIRIDEKYGPISAKDLITAYDGSTMSGTWVRYVEENRSVVRFVGNGGYTTQGDIQINSIDDEFKMPDITAVTRPGFALLGWSLEENPGDNSVIYSPGRTYSYSDIEDKLGKTLLFYAQWKRGENWKYTVNHLKQTVDMKDYELAEAEVLYEPVTGTEEEIAEKTVYVTPVAKDYEGFLEPEGIEKTQISRDGSTVIEIRYDRQTYEIVFDGNGATTGSMNSIRMAVGYADNLPINVYQKEESIFAGWCTNPKGNGRIYTDGQQVKDLVRPGDTITLYAQWVKNGNKPLEPTSGVVMSAARLVKQLSFQTFLPVRHIL